MDLNSQLSGHATQLGFEFNTETASNINVQPEIANGFINKFNNKLVLQQGSDTMAALSSNPLTRFIGNYPLSIADTIELYTQNILPVDNYQTASWVPEKGQEWVNNNLVAYSHTELRKSVKQSTNLNVITMAFTSAGNMAKWLSLFYSAMEKSWNLFEYNLVQSLLLPNIMLSLSIDATKKLDGLTEYQTGMVKILEEVSKSTGNPTWGYNADGRGRILNWCNRGDYVLLVGLKTASNLTTVALPNTFNQQFLNVKELFKPENVIKLNGVKENEFYIVHKETFMLLTRLDTMTTQFFANNLQYLTNSVRWYNPVILPWMPGFRIVMLTSEDKQVVQGGYGIDGTENPDGSYTNPNGITFNLTHLDKKEYTMKQGDYIETRIISDSNKTDFGYNNGTGFGDMGGTFKYQMFSNLTGNIAGGTSRYLAGTNNDTSGVTPQYTKQVAITTAAPNQPTISIKPLNLPDGNYIAQMFGFLQGKKFTSSGIPFTMAPVDQTKQTPATKPAK